MWCGWGRGRGRAVSAVKRASVERRGVSLKPDTPPHGWGRLGSKKARLGSAVFFFLIQALGFRCQTVVSRAHTDMVLRRAGAAGDHAGRVKGGRE